MKQNQTLQTIFSNVYNLLKTRKTPLNLKYSYNKTTTKMCKQKNILAHPHTFPSAFDI